AAAHIRGLIHRDIKPSNIFLSAAGEAPCPATDTDPEADRYVVKLLDFGLARPVDGDGQITHAGSVVGSPSYMSPEQAAGEGLDARSDLFSLGIVLYRMVTHTLPFTGSTTLAILRQIDLHAPAAPRELRPETPEALSRLIMRLLAKKRDERPASAR